MHGRSNSNARKVSSTYAFIIFFKSNFGAGLLALPNALGQVGLPLGFALYLLAAVGCTVTIYLLLRAHNIAEAEILGQDESSASSTHRTGDYIEASDVVLAKTSRPHPEGEVFGDLRRHRFNTRPREHFLVTCES